MDGEHIFSATIVLVMVCAAFPDNAAYTSALNAGLDLLRGMAERGNSHMGARHQLLVNLRNAVIGGGAAGSGATPPPPAAAKPSPGPSLSSVSSTSPRNHAQIHRSPHSSATLQQQSFIQSQQQQQQHHHPHHHGHHHQQQQHPQFPLPALPSGYSAFLSGGAGSPTLSTPPSTHTAMLGVSPTTAALGSMGMGAATNSNDGTGDGSTAAAGAISPGSVPEMPSFTMADEGALRELFFDESAGPSAGGAGMDFGLWEEGFANPAVDAGYDFSQWTVLEGDGRENMGREGL
ncbi:hypothetical protein VTK73DRAFT_9681 [Phialemonium thermophilum]|uniref:Uncharacterized protein n=1 Tax=Phialemonium thermophilum TaxID=223376 RepID=A0ABR3W0Z6_9PEZI